MGEKGLSSDQAAEAAVGIGSGNGNGNGAVKTKKAASSPVAETTAKSGG